MFFLLHHQMKNSPILFKSKHIRGVYVNYGKIRNKIYAYNKPPNSNTPYN